MCSNFLLRRVGLAWPDRPANVTSDNVPFHLSFCTSGGYFPCQKASDRRYCCGRCDQQLQHQRHPSLGDHRRRGLADILHTHPALAGSHCGIGCQAAARSARNSASAAQIQLCGNGRGNSPVAPDADPAPSASAGNERRSSAAAAMSPARPAANVIHCGPNALFRQPHRAITVHSQAQLLNSGTS